MKRINLLLLALLPLSLFSQIYPQNKPSKPLQSLSLAEVNAVFDDVNQQLKQKEITAFADEVCKKLNGTLLIAQNDEILVKRANGYKSLTQSPTDSTNFIVDTTRFELASVSKQFTATAILKLVSENKMALSDLLTRYFPQLPYYNITIHHLLTHTSGLPEYFDFKESWFDTSHLVSNQDIINLLEKEKPIINFNPGENFEYINTNYILLTAIVEQVSGVPFEEYVQKNIFLPAGMSRSCVVTQIADTREKLGCALGHYKQGIPQPLKYLDGTFGDKGLYSTAEDLFRWKKAFFSNQIIPEKYVKMATTPENKLNNGRFPEELYGYGFRIEESPEYGTLIYHGGLWHGYHHVFLYYPEKDIYMVFLSNYCNRAHIGKTSQVLHILCGA